VAVAEALKKRLGDDVRILFVGAAGKMEMEKIPALGYDIVGLPVAGLRRRLSLANLLLPFKVALSVIRAAGTIRRFRADIVAGFGGYASAPALWAAQMAGVPTVIQEQNSYAGATNRILGRRARRICVAYDGMERFFPSQLIVRTGNPLRSGFACGAGRGEALRYFGLTDKLPTLLVLGGSLGTRTLNNMMKRWVDTVTSEGKMQIIWQTGRIYHSEMEVYMAMRSSVGLWRGAFIDRMDYAYAAADLVVSRSGAGTVSELALSGKPAIFVPSPNVAEDHQTHNAMSLVERGAALMVADRDAVEQAMPLAMETIADRERLATLGANIRMLAIPDSAERVAIEIMKISGL
jgi:UDP-N-acetylglucosamine--N-acetylmuramyl-(pentapeptide) pyrophosphoryl-undecaprenol N-acetylglucosamine transferase